ncbi:chalcone isomerase family protein [Flavobacterium sp. U410]
MKKQIVFFLFVALTSLVSVAQTTISGVKVDNKLTIDGQDLVLNGAGLREKMWIDLYVGSLYLPKKSSNANEIMASTEGAAIKLNIVSGMITSEKMINAVNEGFENATGGKTAPLKAKIDKFKAFFKEEIVKGDQFLIVNVPGTGVVVYKNGTKKGVIEGQDFKKALFGIWLCDKPADKNLKAGMLGK